MQVAIDTVGDDLGFALKVLSAVVEGAESGKLQLPSGYNGKRYFEFEGRWFTLRSTTAGYNVKEARESITTLSRERRSA